MIASDGSRKRVGILISGRGSNMTALIDAAKDQAFPARIALVFSNRPDAPGLERARDAGIAVQSLDHRGFPTRESFDEAMHAILAAADLDFLCCAGFMRLVSPGFIERWRDRIMNIHPSLLPAFKGLNPQRQALEAGVKVSGATVHLVRADVDSGPIIAQACVPVLETDTETTLGARILEIEHTLYPHALGLFASGRVVVKGQRCAIVPT